MHSKLDERRRLLRRPFVGWLIGAVALVMLLVFLWIGDGPAPEISSLADLRDGPWKGRLYESGIEGQWLEEGLMLGAVAPWLAAGAGGAGPRDAILLIDPERNLVALERDGRIVNSERAILPEGLTWIAVHESKAGARVLEGPIRLRPPTVAAAATTPAEQVLLIGYVPWSVGVKPVWGYSVAFNANGMTRIRDYRIGGFDLDRIIDPNDRHILGVPPALLVDPGNPASAAPLIVEASELAAISTRTVAAAPSESGAPIAVTSPELVSWLVARDGVYLGIVNRLIEERMRPELIKPEAGNPAAPPPKFMVIATSRRARRRAGWERFLPRAFRKTLGGDISGAFELEDLGGGSWRLIGRGEMAHLRFIVRRGPGDPPWTLHDESPPN